MTSYYLTGEILFNSNQEIIMLEKKIDQENEIVQPEDINNFQADPLITQSTRVYEMWALCSLDDEIFVPDLAGDIHRCWII